MFREALVTVSSSLANGRHKSVYSNSEVMLASYWPDYFPIQIVSIEVKDISLTDYIQTRHAVYVPHTAGRYAKKQFKKAQMPIVERLVDRQVAIPRMLDYRSQVLLCISESFLA